MLLKMSWKEALKNYREQNTDRKIGIPKKGSVDYDCVKRIEQNLETKEKGKDRSVQIKSGKPTRKIHADTRRLPAPLGETDENHAWRLAQEKDEETKNLRKKRKQNQVVIRVPETYNQFVLH